MTCLCPRCGADRIATKGYARRTVCAIGTIAGAVSGAAVIPPFLERAKSRG